MLKYAFYRGLKSNFQIRVKSLVFLLLPVRNTEGEEEG